MTVVTGVQTCALPISIPGMTATSLLPKAAAAAGLPFVELVQRILEGAALGK